MKCMTEMLVVIRGGGDIASGVAHRLKRCGFRVVILEVPEPTVIRRKVAFADAVFEGEVSVEGIKSKLVPDIKAATEVLQAGIIPVMIDPGGQCIGEWHPDAVVDCVLAKKNLGTHIGMAPIVIGVGPGFTARVDVHAVIETKRGHDLGRVIHDGAALPNTGIPGNIEGYTEERILRACDAGFIQNVTDIGSMVRTGDIICKVNGKPVAAGISGVVRGLLRDGSTVFQGMKIGDIDPRGKVGYCGTISDKARAVGGGVLEALLTLRAEMTFRTETINKVEV